MSNSETLEQIALRVAEQIPGFIWCEGSMYEDGVLEHQAIEFAHRLVAAFGAQESTVWVGSMNGHRYIHWGSSAPDFPALTGVHPLFAAPVLPSVPEGWIDVKDRLPDTAGVFLVICDRGVQSYHPIIGVFNRDFDSPYPWSVPGTATVTHWMPLPAAPSPQEEK